MILSHRHRLIFIRTAKTASSSMAVSLAPLCGPEDVLTPLAKRPERLTPEESRIVPRNHAGRFVPRVRRDQPLAQLKRDLRDLWLGRRYWVHMSAFEVKARAGAAVFDRYFKFCFERNPWDRMVSSFFWHTRRLHNSQPDFATYLRENRARDNFELYTLGGKPMVDFIGQYENLAEDWPRALALAGIGDAPELGCFKSEWRPRDKSYRDYYTVETKRIVARRYAATIELFGYSF